MSVDTAIAVSLADDEMWQSFVAIRIVRKSLLEFTTVTGERLEGFITGIDEDWIQITTRGDFRAVLISLHNLAKVSETGENLRSLMEIGEMTAEDVVRVEKYSNNTRQSAHEFLKIKKELNNR